MAQSIKPREKDMGPFPDIAVLGAWHRFPDHAIASRTGARRLETLCSSLSGESSIDEPIAASDRDR
jgi:hypothetical protein